MPTIITLFLAILMICGFCVMVFGGIKSVFIRCFQGIRGLFNSARITKNRGTSRVKTKNNMQIIQFTTGQCEVCGKNFFGTTSDQEQQLFSVRMTLEQQTTLLSVLSAKTACKQ